MKLKPASETTAGDTITNNYDFVRLEVSEGRIQPENALAALHAMWCSQLRNTRIEDLGHALDDPDWAKRVIGYLKR